MSVRKRRLRTRNGAAIIGLVISILFFILFMGLFAFDANRAQLCQRELIAACDSASITGTAMLASYDTSPNGQTSLAIAQQLSAGYAFNMFTKAVVLGQNLNGAVLKNTTTALYTVTNTRQCNVIIALGDPNNNFQAISYAGDPNGRTVEIFACYGYQPEFLSALPFGMKVTPISASSFGGLPQVDAVVVFDYSGSMDDFTSVLFVRREWWWPTAASTLTGAAGTGNGLPLYSVVTGASPASSNLFSNYLKWSYLSAPAGSGTNVLPPQNLQAVGSGNPAVGNPLSYSNALRANPMFCSQWLGTACMAAGGNPDHVHYSKYVSPNNQLLTLNSNDYGQPPGNYKPVFVNLQDGAGGVASLTPDNALSDTNIVGPPAGNGNPSFWWWHRGTTAPTPNGSGLLLAPPNPVGSTYPAAQAGSLMVSYKNGTVWEPNVWASSLLSPTSNYGFGYPPQPPATNSVYLASAANLPADNLYFTDLVVNLTDPTGGGSEYQTQPIPAITASTLSNFFFTPFTVAFPADEADSRLAGASFDFADLATLVESARGNLDNATNYVGACLDGKVIVRTEGGLGAATPLVANPPTITIPSSVVNTHWQLAYERCAMLESQPYATAADGAENGFFYKLATLADCRYGFIGFSAIQQTAVPTDSYGASYKNCLKGYPTQNLASQGTATANSHLRSGLQYNYNIGAPSATYYYGAGGGSPANPNSTDTSANLGWWRSGQNGLPSATLPKSVNPYISEQVWGFKPPSTPANEGGNAVGFKVPRTQLSTQPPAGSAAPATTNQLCMVASHETGGAAPYNTAPYGDVWSATASNGNANGVWNGRPMTDTYCDEALNTAVANFNPGGTNTNIYYTASSRLAARKAIVFFTDGEPTGTLTGNAAINSKAVANNCQKNQISLFTIGLNMDPTNNGQLTTDQYAFLGDNVNASYGGAQTGLAYYAGNGSRFFQCQNGASVRSAFASIARRLSQAQF